MRLDEVAVMAQENYPSVQVERKNPFWADQLSQALAGEKSEMTAVYQYLYQHWILEQQGNDFARILWRISLVEMRHLEILGQLILALGGDPRCWKIEKRRATYWRGDFSDYTQDLIAMLRANLTAEEGAVKFYRELAILGEDKNIKAILRQFAADEELHARIFRDYLEQLS